MTAGELHDALARLGADLMARALGALERGTLQFTPQPEDGVTYAAEDRQGRDADRLGQAVEDGARPHPRAVAVSRRLVRVGRRPAASRFCAAPKARVAAAPGTVLDDRLTVACGDGAVRIVELQKAGEQADEADEFLRGTPVRRACALG